MKKIGLITLFGNFNYGNKLQNFALQEVFRKKYKCIDTIIVNNNSDGNSSDLFNMNYSKKQRTRQTNYSISGLKRRLYRGVNKKSIEFSVKKRTEIFEDFSNTYLNEKKFEDFTDIPEHEYEHFIIGSDQVWNPDNLDLSDIFFPAFADTQKKSSYAASFGVSKIPPNLEEYYQKELGDFRNVSVREEAGSVIIGELLGRKPPVHVDPTMLLSSSEWINKLDLVKNTEKEDILLVYLLGGGNDNDKKIINQFKKKYNLKVVNIGSIYSLKEFVTGPKDFIEIIRKSKLFCTDSFHGIVFSIIFKTPFVAFSRSNLEVSMSSRIDNLLNKFNFDDRKKESCLENVNLLEMDFSSTDSIIEIEKTISLEYIESICETKEMQ